MARVVISELRGESVELRKFVDHIQWRIENPDAEWSDLVSLADLQGLPGPGAVPADAAVAGYISTAGTSDTKAALLGRYLSVITPELFGAVGDGVADDTEAIQEAIDSAGPRPVVLTRSYKISAPLVAAVDDQTILGLGGVITAPESVNIFETTKSRTIIDGVRTIGGMVVFNVGTKVTYNLRVPSGHDAVIRNCHCSNPYSVMEAWYANNVHVIDNVAVDIVSAGAQFWGGDANPAAGIGYPGVGVYGIDGGLVQGNDFRGVPSGTTSTGCPTWTACAKNVRVIGNHFEQFYDVGIDFEGSQGCIAVGNTVVDCQNGNLATFFASTDCLFEANVCIMTDAVTDTGRTRAGIYVAPDSAKNIVFRGNTIRSAPGFGAQVDGAGHVGIVIESNYFIDCCIFVVAAKYTRVARNVITSSYINMWGADDARIIGNEITATAGDISIQLTQIDASSAGKHAIVKDNIVRAGSGAASVARIHVANTATAGVADIITGNILGSAVTFVTADATTVNSGNTIA